MAKNKTINVKGTEISVFHGEQADYISLTDIARYKDANNTDDIIKNWLRNRNTIELLGFWEQLYNPNFKPVEFDGFRKQAGLNSFVLKVNYTIHTEAIKANLIPQELSKTQVSFVYANEADMLNVALFGKTAKQWRDENPTATGNIRDEATIEQLVVLSNLESINAVFIGQGVPQSERLMELNKMAITQMKSLLNSNTIKKLKAGQ